MKYFCSMIHILIFFPLLPQCFFPIDRFGSAAISSLFLFLIQRVISRYCFHITFRWNSYFIKLLGYEVEKFLWPRSLLLRLKKYYDTLQR